MLRINLQNIFLVLRLAGGPFFVQLTFRPKFSKIQATVVSFLLYDDTVVSNAKYVALSLKTLRESERTYDFEGREKMQVSSIV